MKRFNKEKSAEGENADGIGLERRMKRSRIILCVTLYAVIFVCCAVFAVENIFFHTGVITDSEKTRIYIDQGHNPSPHHNSGAEGNGLYEQDLTFGIGCLLAELLENDGRFEVCLSRPERDTVLGIDNTTSLEARVDGAKKFNADYFISLHINAYTEESACGMEAYTRGGDGEAYSFGSSLLSAAVDATKLKDRGMKQNSEFYVLKHSGMPAVLMELGFISNPDDAALLEQQPELFANGIYEGILAHLEQTEAPRTSFVPLFIGIAAVLSALLAAVILLIGRSGNKTDSSVSNEPDGAESQ